MEQTSTPTLRRINQSLTKYIGHLSACPKKYYQEKVSLESSTAPTQAMINGQYFEWLAVGSRAVDGSIPVMKRLKNGEKSTDQIRIEQQAALFPSIMEKEGIKIARKSFYIEHELDPEVLLFGTTDLLVEYKGRPYVADLKLTKDLTSTFGEFAWGNFDEMDKIQSHLYTWMMSKITGNPWGFIYIVFDYKPNPEYKILEVPFNREAQQDALDRMRGAKEKLDKFEAMGYPAIPSLEQCKTCKVRECADRMSMAKLEYQETVSVTEQLKASIVKEQQAEIMPY